MQKIQQPKNFDHFRRNIRNDKGYFAEGKIRDVEGWAPKAPKEDFFEGGLRNPYGTPKNEGKFPNKLIYPLYLILDFSQKQVGWNLYHYFCGLVLICI